MSEGALTTEASAARNARVLILCSANQCRSPLAGSLLTREVRLRRLSVDVVTAGFGDPGYPATPPTVAAAAELDLDLAVHESRRVDPDLLAGADLVLGMERRHVREAVVLEPSVWRRAFTLREAVRRVEEVGPRSPDEALRRWLERLSAARDRMSLMGASPDDDVRDPTTDITVDHATTAAQLEDLVRRLVSGVWPG